MATEINRNKTWSSTNDIKPRSKKVTDQIKKNNMSQIVSTFINALKIKHLN